MGGVTAHDQCPHCGQSMPSAEGELEIGPDPDSLGGLDDMDNDEQIIMLDNDHEDDFPYNNKEQGQFSPVSLADEEEMNEEEFDDIDNSSEMGSLDSEMDEPESDEHDAPEDVSDMLAKIEYMQDLGMSNAPKHYDVEKLMRMGPEIIKNVYAKVTGEMAESSNVPGYQQRPGTKNDMSDGSNGLDDESMYEDELNELSKGTLSSYASKASKSAAELASRGAHKLANAPMGDEDFDDGEDDDRKAFRRLKGIDKALDKMSEATNIEGADPELLNWMKRFSALK
jgi:hypothetical protein